MEQQPASGSAPDFTEPESHVAQRKEPDSAEATLLRAAACAGGSLAVFLLAAATPLDAFGKYSLAAEHLLAGRLPAERLLDFSPLYLWLNVALTSLGLDPAHILSAAQIALAALSVGLLYALLEPRLGPWAWAGAALFAFDRHVLIYQRVIEPEMVLLTSLLGAFWLLERRGMSAAAGAGLLAAVAVLTRPTFLPIFAAAPLYFWWRGSANWRRQSVLFLLPLLAAFALLRLHTGSFSAPVMNPGTVFFEGNQPLSHGTSAVYPPLVLSKLRSALEIADSAHVHYRTVARAAAGGGQTAAIDPSQVNQMWAGRARAFLLDHPAAAIERLARKLRYALHGFRWHDVPPAARFDRRFGWPAVPFALLAALSLLGLATAARNWSQALPFYVLYAAQMAVMLLFYVSARQRLVLLPAVIFFTLVALRAVLRSKRRPLLAALVAVLALALALPDDAMRDETYRQRGHLRAGPLMQALQSGPPLATRQDDIVQAMSAIPWWVDSMRPAFVPQEDRTLDERLVDELLRRRPDVPAFSADSADFDLARALMRVGRHDEARPILETLSARGFIAYRGSRAASDPRILLAEVLAKDGEPDRALRQLEATLDERPADPFALALLAGIDPERQEEAVAAVDRYYGEPDRRWILGRTLRRLGRAAAAVRQLRPLSELLPDLRPLRVELALALGASGDIDGAAAEFLAANRLHVEPVIEVRTAAELARRWSRLHPDDEEKQRLAARLLEQHGFPSEASKLLDALNQRALEHAQSSRNPAS